MDGSRLRLTGVGEGFTIKITTTLSGVDSPAKVLMALNNLFPEVTRPALEQEPSIGHPVDTAWVFNDVSLATFLQQLHEQRILDTALDAMSMNITGTTTIFRISRQAAVAGKIAFPIPGDDPLGGVFTITIAGEGLEDWLQAATWHAGRSQVPRNINDDHAMTEDGESTTWV